MKVVSKVNLLVISLFISMNLSAKDYFIELDVSSGYNNNVFLESDDIIVNTETDDSSQEDVQNQISLMAGYEFFDGKNSDAKIVVDYYKESLIDNDLDTRITSLSLPFTYYSGNYRLRATGSYMDYQLSGLQVLKYTGSRFDLTRKFGDAKIGIQYGYTKKTPQDTSYDSYDGYSQDVKLYSRFSFEGIKFKLYADLFSNQYQDEYVSNKGFYLQAIASKRFNKTNLSLSAKYKNTNYSDDPLLGLEEGGLAREDGQYSLSYTQDYYLNKYTDLYISSEYISNGSNVDFEDENYNYSQWTNTMGARFSF